jgi:hypothetical protein
VRFPLISEIVDERKIPYNKMRHQSLYVSPIFRIFNPTDSRSKSAWKHISIFNPRISKIKDHGEFKTNLEIKENELIKLNKWLRDQNHLEWRDQNHLESS